MAFMIGKDKFFHVARIDLVGNVVGDDEQLRFADDALLEMKPAQDEVGDNLHESTQPLRIVIDRGVKTIIPQDEADDFRRPHGHDQLFHLPSPRAEVFHHPLQLNRIESGQTILSRLQRPEVIDGAEVFHGGGYVWGAAFEPGDPPAEGGSFDDDPKVRPNSRKNYDFGERFLQEGLDGKLIPNIKIISTHIGHSPHETGMTGGGIPDGN